jgi:hypothetical protein
MDRYRPGDTVYIVANGIFVQEAKVLKVSGGFYTLRLSGTGGGCRLRESRLLTKEEAEAIVKKNSRHRI